ncbi:hypothetical protein [Nonlabens sp.]|uniref:hypothetical protein n=1 Tax=Nonlabens sp. TaxID=1888209 RepID=UPI003F6A0A7B
MGYFIKLKIQKFTGIFRTVTPLIWILCTTVIVSFKGYSLWLLIINVMISALWFLLYPIRFKKLNIKQYRKYLKDKMDELGDNLTETDFYHLLQDKIIVVGNGMEFSFKHDAINKSIELNTHFVLFIKSGGTISFNKNSSNYIDIFNYFNSLDIIKETDLNWKM